MGWFPPDMFPSATYAEFLLWLFLLLLIQILIEITYGEMHSVYLFRRQILEKIYWSIIVLSKT
jgi:hypothetical protein